MRRARIAGNSGLSARRVHVQGSHAAAAWGVKSAPAVVLSWIDMQPGKELLSRLYDRALPEGCEYNLIFGFGGGSGLYSEPNYGAVTLSSQLRPEAQKAAKLVRGFHESHVRASWSARRRFRQSTRSCPTSSEAGDLPGVPVRCGLAMNRGVQFVSLLKKPPAGTGTLRGLSVENKQHR